MPASSSMMAAIWAVVFNLPIWATATLPRLPICAIHSRSAATVPTALDEAVRDGRIQRGQLLLLEAFGGGWTWGSALVRF